jgi:hypothetical protein
VDSSRKAGDDDAVARLAGRLNLYGRLTRPEATAIRPSAERERKSSNNREFLWRRGGQTECASAAWMVHGAPVIGNRATRSIGRGDQICRPACRQGSGRTIAHRSPRQKSNDLPAAPWNGGRSGSNRMVMLCACGRRAKAKHRAAEAVARERNQLPDRDVYGQVKER